MSVISIYSAAAGAEKVHRVLHGGGSTGASTAAVAGLLIAVQ